MDCALLILLSFDYPWARCIVPLHYFGFDELCPYNTLLISGRHKVCPYLYLTTLSLFFFFLFFLHYTLYSVRSTLICEIRDTNLHLVDRRDAYPTRGGQLIYFAFCIYSLYFLFANDYSLTTND